MNTPRLLTSPRRFRLSLLLSLVAVVPAAETSLVPTTPSTVPDYFCTWNVQGFVANYANANDQADQMIEANLFGSGKNQNWLGFYPAIRADLTFLLDDAFDFPLGGGHNHPTRGSIELDAGRFPSYSGTPAERLAKLSKDVKAKGWRDLGLWICNSRPNVDELPIDSETYWSERLRWSQEAGVGSWKVDWGIGIPGKPLWKYKTTAKGRAIAPDVWLEGGNQGDLYRTYDVAITVSIPETIRRIGVFLDKPDANDRRLISCEDEVYIGAGTGSCYGVMRHPLADPMPNGKPDEFFKPSFRDVKRRIDEVTRAVRWHRIAQPFPKGDAAIVDTVLLTDAKSKPAPARIARGGLPLPTVSMPMGGEPPYVLCCRHPTGEIAVASIPRHLTSNGRNQVVMPLADVTVEAGVLAGPIGIFGEFANLTLRTTSDLAGKRIRAQDLAGDTPVDITAEVTIERGALTIPGAVLKRVGLMAATAGDLSDPGLVLVIDGLTPVTVKPAMEPGMFMGVTAPTPTALVTPPTTTTPLALGTPAALRLSADRTSLPDDGSEIRVSITVLDAAGNPLGNQLQGTLEISAGKGLFPTGATFAFNTRGGHDGIEFRSYDQGSVTLTARVPGLPPAQLTVTVLPAEKRTK
jgi:hypothetical protein